eukprot:CAMPEP_0204519186 /NCGR_PEP_ID=MMETSP0661-20131031/4601_1 /ASSEMBLY_ACC=CAM_ASM_000606 /TAXON_ID=109239 /ORGANISM="Alexandrium margalefi, Strain AMGDE01CS-322" /LENGTH=77 /DNA_ID=CAMNT_0051524679 /DNA_START=72 /DNA_END=302 /DNA_ORIENTATION=-
MTRSPAANVRKALEPHSLGPFQSPVTMTVSPSRGQGMAASCLPQAVRCARNSPPSSIIARLHRAAGEGGRSRGAGAE